MTETLDNIASGILASLLIPNLIFTVRYFMFSPWERTKEGVNLLRQKTAISVLLVVIALSVILGPDYPWRPFVRLVAFSAITFFFWIELLQLISIQRKFPYRRFHRKKEEA